MRLRGFVFIVKHNQSYARRNSSYLCRLLLLLLPFIVMLLLLMLLLPPPLLFVVMVVIVLLNPFPVVFLNPISIRRNSFNATQSILITNKHWNDSLFFAALLNAKMVWSTFSMCTKRMCSIQEQKSDSEPLQIAGCGLMRTKKFLVAWVCVCVCVAIAWV